MSQDPEERGTGRTNAKTLAGSGVGSLSVTEPTI
jgi:hypothetical protein